MKFRKILMAAVIAIGALGTVGIGASEAGAVYPVGTVITFPNVITNNGTVSCWENQLSISTSRIDCVKYNWDGSVAQTWQGTMPTWCKGIILRPGGGGVAATLEIANKFWADELPNYLWNGHHGGCSAFASQVGSGAWQNRHVMPETCSGSGCTVYAASPTAGGSWWGPNQGSHPVSRFNSQGWGGFNFPDGRTYNTFVRFG